MLQQPLTILLAALLVLGRPVSANGQKLVASNFKQQILYTGVNNPLQFGFTTGRVKKFLIKGSSGVLTKNTAAGSYNWKTCSPFGGTVTFWAVDVKTKRVVDAVIFRLKNLPNPALYTRTDIIEEYAATELHRCRGISAIIENTDYEVNCTILSFTAVIHKNDSTQFRFSISGPLFSDTLRQALYNLENGETVVFADFQVQVGCETRPRLVTGISYCRFNGRTRRNKSGVVGQ
jgi:hypothetical protein